MYGKPEQFLLIRSSLAYAFIIKFFLSIIEYKKVRHGIPLIPELRSQRKETLWVQDQRGLYSKFQDNQKYIVSNKLTKT